MLPIRSLDLVDSNITQTLTGWTYFLHFPVTGRVARAFSGVFYIGSNKRTDPPFSEKNWKGQANLDIRSWPSEPPKPLYLST